MNKDYYYLYTVLIIVGVVPLHSARCSHPTSVLADQITFTEHKTDSLLIVLGDFNRVNLNHELKYRQHIEWSTRDRNTLNHYYICRSVPHEALGLSDRCLVHLLLTYRQKIKSSKPVVHNVRR